MLRRASVFVPLRTSCFASATTAATFTPFVFASAACNVASVRKIHFPLTPPPMPITYLDTDPLEFALRTEARNFGMDDLMYVRELAFVRIHDNPTVGDFRNMGPDARRKLFAGSGRQDFFRWLTWKVNGKPEHLYHEGW